MTEERMPMPTHGSAPGSGASADRPLDDPRAIQILSTEHWSLLATRSLTWSESFSRTSLFLSVLSASVVALGLVGGATGFGSEFTVFALALLPVTLFVGVATFVRLDEVNLEDAQWVVGMNRIRHAYLELEPELEPYFVTSRYDDEAGLLQSLIGETSTSPVTQPFLAIPGVIAVVDSVVAGATVGIAGLGLGLGTAGCLILGGVGLAASVVAFAAWARKQIVRWGS